MNRTTAAGLLAAAALLAIATGCAKLQARDRVNKGVQAFKSAKYAEAVEHFKSAADLDPTFPYARLYLASAYMSQYIPGAESPENLEMAKSAFNEFQKVLEMDPNSKLAIASIATLYFHQKKWDDAEKWNQRLIAVDSNAKEAYYTLGVIAWTRSFQKRMEARAKLGMKPEDPGPIKDKKIREGLASDLGPTINAGLDNLKKALNVDVRYDDAMAYMNLLHRERADLQGTKEEYKADVDQADLWVQKTLETKKQKQQEAAEKQAQGIVKE
jgi:Tfp pilus assembly protein PilF